MIALALAFGFLGASEVVSPRPVTCSYVALPTAEAPQQELEGRGPCGSLDGDGTFHVDAETRRALVRDGSPPAPLFVDGQGWWYVAASGRTVRVPTFDNGPDAFADGVVRTLVDGRIGYVDLTLETVVPPRFDFGWPFEEGRARVCMGCVLSPPDDDGHRTVEGGRWGIIDTAGREIVPLRFTREELEGEEAAGSAGLTAPPSR